jgi:hypothetical protein
MYFDLMNIQYDNFDSYEYKLHNIRQRVCFQMNLYLKKKDRIEFKILNGCMKCMMRNLPAMSKVQK